MLSLNIVFRAIIPQIECIMGIALNAFITVVNGMDWVKRRRLNSADILLTSIAISRFFLLWIGLMDALFQAISMEWTSTLEYANALMALFILFDCSSLWLIAWLSVLYCVKIANYSHPLFIHLKMKISKMVPWLVLGSVLASSVSCVSFAWVFYRIQVNNSSDDFHLNTSMETSNLKINFLKIFPTLCLQFFLAICIICISATLLITSLCCHTTRIVGSLRSPSLDAHYHAITFVGFFTTCYVCYTVISILITPGILSYDGLDSYILNVLLYAFQFIHAIIIIRGNSKLNRVFVKLLQGVIFSRVIRTS